MHRQEAGDRLLKKMGVGCTQRGMGRYHLTVGEIFFLILNESENLTNGIILPSIAIASPSSMSGTLRPIIMVQWKMGVSPVLVSFHLGRFSTSMIMGGKGEHIHIHIPTIPTECLSFFFIYSTRFQGEDRAGYVSEDRAMSCVSEGSKVDPCMLCQTGLETHFSRDH